MSDSQHPLGETPPAVVQALTQLLRPLVRLLLRHQFTYPMLVRLLKGIYVEVAAQEFPVPGKAQTDSRISLLTGVHRKDVKRLWRGEAEARAAPTVVTLGSQLVARWTTDVEFLDEDAQPRPLPRTSNAADTPSFETLVASVSRDIRPRAVLDEWLRLGVARVDEQDHVWLLADAFVPEKGFDEKAWFFGRNVHDHIAACVHNLAGGDPPLLERSVFSNDLAPASVAELAAIAREQGQQAIHAVTRRAFDLERADVAAGTATERVHFGVYFYTAPRAPTDPDTDG